jgi:hypothetical protein
MPTLTQIRTAVDDKLTTLWGAIEARQDAYAAAHNGRYWQALSTHNVTPADGVEVLPDIGTRCPSDQQGEPYPLAIRNSPLPMALKIDVYDGPYGTGFVATVFVSVNGKTYCRSAQVGPETERAHNWREMIEAVEE